MYVKLRLRLVNPKLYMQNRRLSVNMVNICIILNPFIIGNMIDDFGSCIYKIILWNKNLSSLSVIVPSLEQLNNIVFVCMCVDSSFCCSIK